jgi:hypothetical protein
MYKIKTILLAAIPLTSLAFASLGSATNKKIIAALASVSGVADGTQAFDCSVTSCSGKRAHIQAEARGLDSCGNPTSRIGGGPEARAVASLTGSSQSTTFDDGFQTGPCGTAVQHRATVQSHVIDAPCGQELLVSHTPSGGNSGCWNTDFSTGACSSATPNITRNSSLTFNGACSNRNFVAASWGSPP